MKSLAARTYAQFILGLALLISVAAFIPESQTTGRWRFDPLLLSGFRHPFYLISVLPKVPIVAIGAWFGVGLWIAELSTILMIPERTRRGAAAAVFACYFVRTYFFYGTYFLLSTFFFLVVLPLLFFPGRTPREAERGLSLLRGILCGIYLCSSIMKMNARYLSGATIATDVSFIAYHRTHAWMVSPATAPWIAIGGLTLELLGGLSFLPGLGGLRWAILLFHCGISSTIRLSYLLGQWGILVILALDDGLNDWRFFLRVWAILLGVQLVDLLVSALPIPDGLFQAITSILNQVTILGVAGMCVWQSYRMRSPAPQAIGAVSSPRYTLSRYTLSGLIGIVLFCLVNRLGRMPGPLGFTQYSHRNFPDDSYVLSVRRAPGDAAPVPDFVSYRSWDYIPVYLSPERKTFSLPSPELRSQVVRYYCSRSARLSWLQYDWRGGLPVAAASREALRSEILSRSPAWLPCR